MWVSNVAQASEEEQAAAQAGHEDASKTLNPPEAAESRFRTPVRSGGGGGAASDPELPTAGTWTDSASTAGGGAPLVVGSSLGASEQPAVGNNPDPHTNSKGIQPDHDSQPATAGAAAASLAPGRPVIARGSTWHPDWYLRGTRKESAGTRQVEGRAAQGNDNEGQRQ